MKNTISTTDYVGMRLRLGIRDVMLNRADRSETENTLLQFKFRWASEDEIARVIAELKREGFLTEGEKNKRGSMRVVWHEEPAR